MTDTIDNKVENKGSCRFNRFKKGAASLLIGASLLGNGLGCAAASMAQDAIHYEFLVSYGEYKLIRKNNDIYLEKLDGSDNKRITNTPEIHEGVAFFKANGKYIVFSELYGKDNDKFCIIDKDKNDEEKREITLKEFQIFSVDSLSGK